jgi:hypothetical protein
VPWSSEHDACVLAGSDGAADSVVPSRVASSTVRPCALSAFGSTSTP